MRVTIRESMQNETRRLYREAAPAVKSHRPLSKAVHNQG